MESASSWTASAMMSRLGPLGLGLEQVGWIQHDLNAVAAQGIDQLARLGRGTDGIGEFGLDAEDDVVTLRKRQQDFELAQHLLPGGGGVVIGVVTPLIGGVVAAGAQRHQVGAHDPRLGGNGGEGGAALRALSRVRMEHVVGGGDGGDRNATGSCSRSHGVGRRCGNFNRQRTDAGTGHVVLHGGVTGGGGLVQHRIRLRALEGLGEDSEPHQTAPVTSARATGLPLSTDRAMAAMPRTEAMPSSISAPVSGVPLRMLSAKASS